ncbi:hypothetical protein [Microvirga sp. VF16]|uniref:hypothetical protein n=1 Tax=Microvirga sp. VF16 TaxID=2807101 RepID=UPI00193E0561|nr:hypothetical protein [Microvirga sp. VF16]QRM30708.1 hypothetical protein JO965_06835 [Microvirga sp. VF16]
MSKLESDRHRTHVRHRSTQLALKLTRRRIEETERVLDESRKLLEQPIYPEDPRTVPKRDQ